MKWLLVLLVLLVFVGAAAGEMRIHGGKVAYFLWAGEPRTCSWDILWTSEYMFNSSEVGVGTCAQLCYEYNQQYYHDYPCRSFQLLNESSLLACQLMRCDSDELLSNPLRSGVGNGSMAWMDVDRTPLAMGVFMTEKQRELYRRFELVPQLTCDDNYTISTNDGAGKAVDCQHYCMYDNDCMAFILDTTKGCTIKNHCFAESTSQDSIMYSRLTYDDGKFSAMVGQSCLASGQARQLDGISLSNYTVPISSFDCRYLCEQHDDCKFFEIDEFRNCHFFKTCDATSANLPEYVAWEALQPVLEEPPCSVSHPCLNGGACQNTYCTCNFPYFGKHCQFNNDCDCRINDIF